MKFLAAAAVLLGVALNVGALPAGYYPAPQYHQIAPAPQQYPHIPDHPQHVSYADAIHKAETVKVVGGVIHHITPPLADIVGKVAPLVTHALGAFISSSSGYHPEHDHHH